MALSWASDTKPPVLATTTPQLIKQRLEQIEAGCGQVVTAACFSYIALSRFGLTRQELLDVLSLDNGAIKAYGTANMPEGISRFPFVRLALWQHMAGSLIEMVETDGGCLLCIASTAVLDAVQARYLAVAKAAAARTLCDYWSGRWAGTPKQLGQGVATNRLVPEQVTTRRFSICSGFEIIRACVCVCVDAMGSFLHQEKKSPSELCVPGHLFLHVGSAPLHALALMGDDQPLLFDGPVPRENVRALYELPHALVAGGDVEGLDHHVCFDFAFLQRFLQRAPVPEAIALIMQANEFVLGHKAARGVVFVLMVVVPFCSVFGDEHAHTNKHAQTLFLSFSLSLSLFLSLSVYGIAIVLPRLFYCSYPPATWMCLVFASFNLQQSTSQSQLTVGGRRSSYEWSVPARRQPQAQVAPHLVTTPPPLKQTKRQYISPQQGGRYGVSPSASRPESHMGAHTQSKYLVPEVLSTVASRAASPTSTSRAVSRMGTVGRSPSQTQSAYRHPSVGSSAVTRGPYKSHPQDPLMAKKSFVSDLSNIGRKPGRSPFRR